MVVENLYKAVFMMGIGYFGIFVLGSLGVGFSELAFTPIGFIAIFNLALMYTFYFRL